MFIHPSLLDVRPRLPWREFDALFRDFGNHPAPDCAHADARETADGYTFTLDAPGFEPGDFEITATEDSLRLAGRRKLEVPDTWRPLRRERSPLAFSRSWTFARAIDPASVTASFKEGVLTVQVGKRPEHKPVAVQVQVKN
jgi:HSP20 family protein